MVPNSIPTSALPNGGGVRSNGGGHELVALAQSGDEAAIERLWMENEAALRGHLARLLDDPRDVAEAAQEVFIRMLKALPSYAGGDGAFRGWLLRIARNHAIDVLRRDGRSRVERDEALERLRESAGAEPMLDPVGWLDSEQAELAVSDLPVQQQRVLLLRFGFGFKSEEVAAMLGCTPEAVRQQQSRALRRLEGRLRDSGD